MFELSAQFDPMVNVYMRLGPTCSTCLPLFYIVAQLINNVDASSDLTADLMFQDVLSLASDALLTCSDDYSILPFDSKLCGISRRENGDGAYM